MSCGDDEFEAIAPAGRQVLALFGTTDASAVAGLLLRYGAAARRAYAAAFRILRGPRAQDRVVGFDSLYVNAMLLLLTFGIRTGSTLYFEAALIIALLGFVSTVVLAKFLLRGEVIE